MIGTPGFKSRGENTGGKNNMDAKYVSKHHGCIKETTGLDCPNSTPVFTQGPWLKTELGILTNPLAG
jgi:hypothetical protein